MHTCTHKATNNNKSNTMNKISGRKTLDRLDEQYKEFTKAYSNYPMSKETMDLVSMLESYRMEAIYYHDKFVETLYS